MPEVIENIGAGEGNRTLVFSLEVRRSREVLQRFFRQIAAKHPYRFQKTILRCRNAFEAVAAEVARVAYQSGRMT
jgi:hypothetical protein